MGRWRRLEALTQHVVAKADTASATESQTHIPAGQLTSAPAGGVEQHQSTAPHPGRILTDDEKRSLYHNGFVIIRDVVRKDVVQRIHDEIENSPTNSNGRHAAYAPEPACAFCDVCLPPVPAVISYQRTALFWAPADHQTLIRLSSSPTCDPFSLTSTATATGSKTGCGSRRTHQPRSSPSRRRSPRLHSTPTVCTSTAAARLGDQAPSTATRPGPCPSNHFRHELIYPDLNFLPSLPT